MLDLAAEADEILAASPYVTEGRLFKKCVPKRARLYTAFSALNFISGASSLRILKGLLSKGVTIYNVDFLHAKVVMINGEHFSLGSQNLTVRGRRTNIEASFVSGADTPTKEVKEFFSRIHKIARVITAQEIAEMEKLIQPWAKKFKEIEQAGDGIDQFLEAKRKLREKLKKRMRAALERKRREEQEQAKREAEERVKREQAEQAKLAADKLAAAEKSERMKRAISRLHGLFSDAPPAAQMLAWVETVTNNSTGIGGHWTTTTDSLLPVDRDQNFENLLAAINIKPKKFSRYLIINGDDGKLGFVRFAKTRWTYFENGIYLSERLSIPEMVLKVEIEFDWTPTGSLQQNGIAHLRSNFDGSPRLASVGFAFSVKGIELCDMTFSTALKPGRWLFLQSNFRVREAEIKELLKPFLARVLTRPFKFARNLGGRQALEFFGQRKPVKYQIQAHRFGDTAIFSAHQFPRRKKAVRSFSEMEMSEMFGDF